jgi:hypothetical protein
VQVDTLDTVVGKSPSLEIKSIHETTPIHETTNPNPTPTPTTNPTPNPTTNPTPTPETTPKPLFSFLIKFKKNSSNHKNGGIKKYRIGRGNRIIIEE